MNLTRIIQEVQPDEIYNLAAMSHVKVSFDTPEYTANADGIGTLRILEAVRLLGLAGKTKFYQASTSELYGLVPNTLQDEKTPFYPRSPYAAAKLYAYWTTVYYRDTHHIHASNGILFNHESPLRGETFVTRKITRGVSKIVLGQQASIQLGNLSSSRDWGHAKDYVRAMHMLMQQEKPGDYVIATGITTTVRDFVKLSFQMAGILLTFEGENENETAKIESVNVPTFVEAVGQDYLEAIQKRIGEVVVSVDKQYFRPTEVNFLRGDRGKAEKTFGWKPLYDLEHLCADMMQSDIKLMKKDALLKASGFQTMRYFE
jgi:GDPmannose 4,6-dehydratase